MESISLVLDFECYFSSQHGGFVYRQLAYIPMDEDLTYLIDIYNSKFILEELSQKDQDSVNYVIRKIHHLPLIHAPTQNTSISTDELEPFLLRLHSVFGGTFAYKGGQCEKILLKKLGIHALNLEDFGCPKARKIREPCLEAHRKFRNHCPQCEVASYKKFITWN